jgi:hypothetical protein
MQQKIKKIATQILEKEAADRTKVVKVGITLDKNSVALLKKTIRQISGFSNFVGNVVPVMNLNILINQETTNDRKFKADLKAKLSRLRNVRFEVV